MNKTAPLVSLQPTKTQRASELIYTQLHDMIVNGDLKPGDRLPSERAMMEQLHRSRPTVREALRMLERDGFIRIVPGSQGAIVQELSTKNIEQSLQVLLQTSHISLEQLAEMRSTTDVTVAEWAALRRTQTDIEELDRQIGLQEASLDDFAALARLDPAFHAALGRAAHNDVAVIFTQVFSRVIEELMNDRMRNADTTHRREMSEKIVRMHRDIVDAIRAQNAVKARETMQAHLDAFQKDLSET